VSFPVVGVPLQLTIFTPLASSNQFPIDHDMLALVCHTTYYIGNYRTLSYNNLELLCGQKNRQQNGNDRNRYQELNESK
jgi:hypothetical protein